MKPETEGTAQIWSWEDDDDWLFDVPWCDCSSARIARDFNYRRLVVVSCTVRVGDAKSQITCRWPIGSLPAASGQQRGVLWLWLRKGRACHFQFRWQVSCWSLGGPWDHDLSRSAAIAKCGIYNSTWVSLAPRDWRHRAYPIYVLVDRVVYIRNSTYNQSYERRRVSLY